MHNTIFLAVLAAFALTTSTAMAQNAQPQSAKQQGIVESCRLEGVVHKITERYDSPWEGVPSLLAETYTEVTLQLMNVSKHESNSDANTSRCTAFRKGEARVYKVCSKTPIKRGDHISAVDGGVAGTKRLCLFDIMPYDAYLRASQRQPGEAAAEADSLPPMPIEIE